MGHILTCDNKKQIQSQVEYHNYVTQHIERYQLSKDWIVSYGDTKSKYLKIIIVPKTILRFHTFWNLQYLVFKLGPTWRIWCKNSVFG